MAPSLTLFFIVEPPNYDSYACYLAASIREHLPGHIKLVGYCPAAKRDEVHPAVVETLTRMDCELRTFETVNRFDPAYPHGNKILACLEERETDFAGFVDSDVIFIKDQDLSEYLHHDKVSCSPAVSMKWTDQSIWDQVYGALDMSLPVERMALMRQKKQVHLPYYSSGIVYFSEIYRTGDGQRFPQVWMDTAQRIDAAPDIRRKRPYLDQLSLAPAIRRAGLGWCPLPEEQNFALGGRMRGKPLPEDRDIAVVHYRYWAFLEEAGVKHKAYEMLQNHAGARRIRRVPGSVDPNRVAESTAA
jgi:hypothetical protein